MAAGARIRKSLYTIVAGLDTAELQMFCHK